MKIRLSVSEARYEELRTILLAHGIEVDEAAELVLTESDRYPERLSVRDMETGVRIYLPVLEIVSIESFGHAVEVYTRDRVYQTPERIYRLAGQLDPEKFLRISNSAIVARDKIEKITPTLSMKFILELSGGRRADVTRSYYYIFKNFLGI